MVVLKNPLLIAFEKVCQLKTVHAAANDLGLTQAALTKRIRQLEAELGLSLFLRSRRGMDLTNEGRALLNYCKTSNEAEGLFVSLIKGNSQQQVALTIAGPTSAISTRVVQDCLSLYKKYPYLKLNFKADDSSDLVGLVRRAEVDMAIVSPEYVPNEMDSKLLKPDKYLLVASAKWRGRHIDKIIEEERIIDFYESDQTTLNYLKHFKLDKLKRRDRLFINGNDGLIQMFKAGVGFGTLTESVAKPHLEKEELIKLNQGQVSESPLALVWYQRTQKSDYFSDLVRLIK